MSDLSFNQLRDANETRAALWHPGFPHDRLWSLADWSNAVCGEAGEMANVVKKIRRQETGVRGAQDPEMDDLILMLADEVADVVTYADLLLTKVGIPLSIAVREKFNAVSRREGFPITL